LLIPGRTLLFSGGKAGWLYLVNSTNMGHISGSASADTNIVQTLSGVGSIHGGAAWWDTATASYAYIWPASGNHLRQLNFSRAAGQFSLPIPFSQSLTTGGSGQPGGILSLSANGTNPTTGIVWASVNTSADANQRTVAGTLHAYDARFVAKELWNSDKVASRDALGNFAKFVAPTVANGKVYMATFSNRLNIYGLLPLLPITITLTASNVTIYWPTNNGGGFVLQSSIDLVNWSSVASTISASDGSYTTTVPATNSMCFYRLKR